MGTILLIAVTVALAAVVATLVGGLGTTVIPPSVTLSATARVEGNNLILTLTHGQGATINITDLRLVVSVADGGAPICDNAFGDYLVQPTSATSISVGHDYVENIPLTTPSGTVTLSSNDSVSVRVTHTPSNATIFSSDVNIGSVA